MMPRCLRACPAAGRLACFWAVLLFGDVGAQTDGCTDNCIAVGGSDYSSDGWCDDGGAGAQYNECGRGQDCTDCGVRLMPPLPPRPPPLFPDQICVDNCIAVDGSDLSRDGECDDGGAGAAWASCLQGQDCTDCGSRVLPPPSPLPPPPPLPTPPSPTYTQHSSVVTLITDGTLAEYTGSRIAEVESLFATAANVTVDKVAPLLPSPPQMVHLLATRPLPLSQSPSRSSPTRSPSQVTVTVAAGSVVITATVLLSSEDDVTPISPWHAPLLGSGMPPP